MEKVELTGEKRRGTGGLHPKAARNYTQQTFSMFSRDSQKEHITLRFINQLRGVAYDRFGDVITMPGTGAR